MTKTELKEIFEKGLDPTFAAFDNFLIFVVDGKMDPFARTKKMYMKITMGVIRTILGLILLRY